MTVAEHSVVAGETDRRSPWRFGTQALTLGTAIGAAGVIAGHVGASGSPEHSAQLAWAAVAIGAVGIAGFGNAVMLAAGARSVTLRRAQVTGRIDALITSREVGNNDRWDDGGPHGGGLVAGSGMTRYHRSGCLMAQGRRLRGATQRAHEKAGRRPCEICRPDGDA